MTDEEKRTIAAYVRYIVAVGILIIILVQDVMEFGRTIWEAISDES